VANRAAHNRDLSAGSPRPATTPLQASAVLRILLLLGILLGVGAGDSPVRRLGGHPSPPPPSPSSAAIAPSAGLAADLPLRAAEAEVLLRLAQERAPLAGDTVAAYQRAYAIGERTANRGIEAAALDGLAMGDLYAGRTWQALAAFSRALRLAREVGDPHLQATLLYHTAGALAIEHHDETAAALYTAALRRWAADGDRRGQARAHAGLADTLAARGKNADALRSYGQALVLFRQLGDRAASGGIQQAMGDLAAHAARPDQALELYRQALTLARQAGDRQLALRSTVALDRVYRRTGDRATARRYAEQALRTLDTLSPLASRPQVGPGFATLRGWTTFCVDYLMETQRLNPSGGYDRRAFRISELARARDLLGALAQRRGEERRTAPLAALNLAAIQRQLLDHDTVLIEFFLGPERSYLWTATASTVESFELPARGVIEAEAHLALERVRTSHPWAAANGADADLLKLSTTLLGPIAHQIQGKRLVIVPDGDLRGVPFTALPLPDEPQLPVVARHEVVVLPAVSALWVMRQREASRPVPDKLLAVLADPVYQPDDPRVAPRPGAAAPSRPGGIAGARIRFAGDDAARLPRLPFSSAEAAAIAALAPPGQALEAVGFAANLSLATSDQLRRYSIVHFAAHSWVSPQDPGLSAMVLSLVDRHGSPRNGLLNSREISALHLPANLVVLSTCKTALAQGMDGDSLNGLGEAFLAAGATRVVTGLWNVDDRASAELMQRFYRGMLRQHLAPAAALRAAELELRQDPRFRSPYYWSAFTLEGDWRAPAALPTTGRKAGS
jgi:CHAT domain-containing protein